MLINYSFLENNIINHNQEKNSNIVNSTQEDINNSNGYQLADPINISSWSDWALYDFITTGNGSDTNPFIIENIEIIGTGVKTMQSYNRTILNYTYGGIFINANGSFIIRNCKISQTSIGIHFSIGIAQGTNLYRIENVQITNCSIGIYSRWPHIGINISNCYISKCKWISTATLEIHDHLDQGGIGIWVRSKEGSTIENCRIEDCSIGMMTEAVEFIHNNELINCGIVLGTMISNYDSTNTVNGKPIGLFWGVDDLVFTQIEAAQYGQLIFVGCANLRLSNIHIIEPSSIGIQLYATSLDQQTHMNNIICENQNLGFYIFGRDVIGDNLYAKNCDAGFFFDNIRTCTFTRIMTDNTKIPIYGLNSIILCTIEIEQYTKFYLVDYFASYLDKLHVENSYLSYNISMSNISELCVHGGYIIQFNDTKSYQVSLFISPQIRANFTIISVPPYTRSDVSKAISGYPFVWLLSLIIIGLLIYIKSYWKLFRK